MQLSQAREALTAARAGFLPSLDVQARYTRAAGGRQIDFPAGDLLNPVYGTLNDLLRERGQDPAFPTIDNQQIPFLRDPEQETQLRLQQALFEPRVLHAYRARRHEVDAQRSSVEAFRRELVRDVKVAYFRYLQAEQRVAISLEASRTLVAENVRTNERLYAAHTVTQDVVLRAEAEELTVAQSCARPRPGATRRGRTSTSCSTAHLQTPDDPQPADPAQLLDAACRPPHAVHPRRRRRPPPAGRPPVHRPPPPRRTRPPRRRRARRRRDFRSVAQSAFLPGVSLAVDAGIQGTDYGFAGDRPFVLASVVLRWNLFNGFADRAQVEQARLQTRRLQTRRTELARQIDLQVQTARDAVRVAQRSRAAARRRAEAARTGFRLTKRRYEEGRANQVTFLDARTTRTQADLNLAVTRTTLLIRLAELEFALGMANVEG